VQTCRNKPLLQFYTLIIGAGDSSETLVIFSQNRLPRVSVDRNLHNVTSASIAKQPVDKHILAATNTQTIEELPFLCNDNIYTSL
jgi:hypothetical protein